MHLGLQTALRDEKGFAVGKLGYSEQAWLKFPEVYESNQSPLTRTALRSWIHAHAYRQSGVFPGTLQFILEFCQSFKDFVEEADYLAVASGWENTLKYQGIDESKALDFWALEPDRSSPYNQENCYLHLLKNKRILIINSIGDTLLGRANKETFEAVWAKIGRPWFEPANVTAVTFPFVYDEKVQSQYGNVWNIYDLILNQLEKLVRKLQLTGYFLSHNCLQHFWV